MPDADRDLDLDHEPGPTVPDKPRLVPDAYKLRTRFGFAFEPLLVPFSVAVGVTPATAHVTVDVDDLEIRFGLWVLRTPRSNVAGVELTGPYRFAKVAGPPHISFADRGVTFATNRRRGACIRFRDDVAALLPRGILTHPAATVTVADPEALAELLS